MHRFGFSVVVAVLLLGLPQQARAQSRIEVTDVGVFYDFGQHVTFEGRIQSPIPIISAALVFNDNFDESVRRFPVDVGQDGVVTYRYDVTQNVLRPFVTISFWFEVTLQNGQTLRSDNYHVQYVDDRFTWQQQVDGTLRVHWYEGDAAFGDALLDVSRRGLNAVSAIIPASQAAPLDVYVYASTTDLQSALFLGGESWQGGHANPKLGVVMLAVAPGPGQSIDMETLIPHELAHVMLYRSVGEGYATLPVWLSEGIASLAELYPNPDYDQALTIASQNDSLLPVSDLCNTFPLDASRAYLAYAESQSFVRFLRDSYGTPALFSLTSAYADGLSCDQGVVRALGTSLVSLDTRWRESVLGQNVMGVFLRNMLPYLGLFVFMLLIPLIGFFQKRPADDESR
ncbi:MAG: peptidase MA family metallohydrolase [Anaerolineales bacterium]